MKLKLHEEHGFKKEYVEKMIPFLNVEMHAEEIIQLMIKHSMVPIELENGIVSVLHPHEL